MARLIAENVSLYFPVANAGKHQFSSARNNVGGAIETIGGKSVVCALNNVSFDLKDGDRLALQGHNGSGKSTLLRVLAGIYKPQRGRVIVEGTLGNALNLNLGVRLEATGRRNIFLKGLMAGVSAQDMQAVIDDVEAFTGLGSYLDQPIRTYSSGMLMRLSFALATAFKSEVLLLDEWLGIGDAAFQEAARARMEEFASTKILVLASHNKGLLKKLCNKNIRLQNGTVVS